MAGLRFEAISSMEKRPLSALRYERIQETGGSPRLITLHDHDQAGDAVADLARAVAPGAHIIGLESYKGVYVGRQITGYTWYPGPIDQPPPVFFGDSLIEIEKFLLDELDRQQATSPERPFLLGVRQGAVLALAAALVAPDALSGIIAVDGMLPTVPGWSPPLAPLDGLPILLAGAFAPANVRATVLAGPALAEQLTAWGASVETCAFDADGPPEIARWLSAQSPRFGGPASGTPRP
jgi:predicted esterase